MKSPLALGVLLALGNGTLAADLSAAPPSSIAPAFDWSGFYAGVEAGYGAGSSDATVPGTHLAFSPDSAIGGVQIGYNVMLDKVVLGIETDIAYTNAEDDLTPGPGVLVTNSIDWLGTTTARLGWAFDNALVYAKGGVAYGRQEFDVDVAGGPRFSEAGWRAGWTLGGGIEYAFTRHLTAQLEYNYVDLGSGSFVLAPPPIPVPEVDFHASLVEVGLNYKF